MSAEVLKREFLFAEGLGSFETVLDDPLVAETADPILIQDYLKRGDFSLGALIILLNDTNKLVITINNKEDLEALTQISDGIAELVVKVGDLFGRIETAAEERRSGIEATDGKVLEFKIPKKEDTVN